MQPELTLGFSSRSLPTQIVLTVFSTDATSSPEPGECGFSVASGKVSWAVDASRPEGIGGLASRQLRFTLFDELHHQARGWFVQVARPRRRRQRRLDDLPPGIADVGGVPRNPGTAADPAGTAPAPEQRSSLRQRGPDGPVDLHKSRSSGPRTRNCRTGTPGTRYRSLTPRRPESRSDRPQPDRFPA
jgi:hypothetical protein